MSLENVFYSLGILYMVLGLVIMIAIAIMVFFVFKKVTEIAKIVEEKLDQVKKLADNPAESAFKIGAKVAEKFFFKEKARKR